MNELDYNDDIILLSGLENFCTLEEAGLENDDYDTVPAVVDDVYFSEEYFC